MASADLEEEFHIFGVFTFWWSLKSEHICKLEFDEEHTSNTISFKENIKVIRSQQELHLRFARKVKISI